MGGARQDIPRRGDPPLEEKNLKFFFQLHNHYDVPDLFHCYEKAHNCLIYFYDGPSYAACPAACRTSSLQVLRDGPELDPDGRPPSGVQETER